MPTFKVPINVLARPRSAGGLSLQQPQLKSQALFAARWLSASRAKPPTFSGAWLLVLQHLYADVSKAPPAARHLDDYKEIVGQAAPPAAVGKQLARDLYTVMLQANSKPPRITEAFPQCPWDQVWAALSCKLVTSAQRSAWYLVVTGVIRTNLRLHRIRARPSPACDLCGEDDDLVHRLTACPPLVRQQWDVLAGRVAHLLGVRAVGPELLLRPALALGRVARAARESAAVLLAQHVHRVIVL